MTRPYPPRQIIVLSAPEEKDKPSFYWLAAVIIAALSVGVAVQM